MSVTVNGTAAAAPEPAGASDQASDSLAPNPYVSIILTCYNEHGHVTAEVARICEAMDVSGYDYELLAFDDASTYQNPGPVRDSNR